MLDDTEQGGLVGNTVYIGLYEHLGKAAQSIESARDVIRQTLMQHGGGLPQNTSLLWEWQWVMETLQGEFDAHTSASQLAGGACLGLIPVVDQLQDSRDLIAKCKEVMANTQDHEHWISLSMILIGLFPSVTSPAKEILKIAFAHTWGEANIGHAVARSSRALASFITAPNLQPMIGRVHPSMAYRNAADTLDALKAGVSVSQLLDVFDAWSAQMHDIRYWGGEQMTIDMCHWWDDSLAVVLAAREQAEVKLADSHPALLATLNSVQAALRREARHMEQAFSGAFDDVTPDEFHERHRENITRLSANLKCILGALPA